MTRKIAVLLISQAMLFSMVVIIVELPTPVSAGTIYVDDDYGSENATHKKTIQAGVDNATSGDTVYVYNGTYYENVVVTKTIILMGEGRENTTIDGGGSGDVVYVDADGVNITGFTITNGGSNSNDAGICVGHSQNCKIINNNVSSNHYHGIYTLMFSPNALIKNNNIYLNPELGIRLSSTNNEITENNISMNGRRGISISISSDSNIITNNNISWNNWDGINLGDSTKNDIIGNNIFSHSLYGIRISGAIDNNIISNNIFSNYEGIYAFGGSNNIIGNDIHSNNNRGLMVRASSNHYTIMGNNISHNNEGIFIDSSGPNNNSMIGNNISNNNYGIKIQGSPYNEIINNNLCNNSYGVYLYDSTNNNTVYHNNFINNVNQVYLDTSTCFNNTWDDSEGKGNYWDDYQGVDNGSGGREAGDGVGDTEIPHPFIDQGNGYYKLDNYPLVTPFGKYLFLKQGWNLISIPLIQVVPNFTNVLGSIDGLYDAIQWYDITDTNDPWKHYKVGKPFGNDLSEINETMGFWIHITQPGDTIFLYNGTQFILNQSIPLHPGWNMVGYPSLTSYNRTEGLNNLTFGSDVDAIWTHNATTKLWEELGPTDYFEVGRGYWIHSKVTKTWVVPL
jgi:parallel beta-helix repeat protein